MVGGGAFAMRQLVVMNAASGHSLPTHSAPAPTNVRFAPKANIRGCGWNVRFGRVEDGRGSLGHSASLRFPSPLIEPDVPD
jgi:hypothetical protein